MNDQNLGSPEDKRLPSCNVNQTFNYGVGVVALIVAAVIYFFLLR